MESVGGGVVVKKNRLASTRVEARKKVRILHKRDWRDVGDQECGRRWVTHWPIIRGEGEKTSFKRQGRV